VQMRDSGRTPFDVLLVGSGLGATACARALAREGMRVGFVAGVGRSRSLEADGGVVDPQLVLRAFGEGAPLGAVVTQQQMFRADNVDSAPLVSPVEEMPPRQTYRRIELERWARERAVAAGAEYAEGFIEETVPPAPGELLELISEAGDQTLSAGTIALCEGSDPRISMRAGLRPDYDPEDQLHFAKTIIERPAGEAVYSTGNTRASRGMPIGITVVPLEAGLLVSVVARIENIMRCNRSSTNALDDLLASRLGMDLGLQGERIHTGVELSAMRRNRRNTRLSHNGLFMSLDVSGMLDPREPQRADVTIRSGMHLARFLMDPGSGTWEEFVAPLLQEVRAINPHWIDSRSTGFIEEPGTGAGRTGALSRAGSGLLRKLRVRD
jgi:flavin-dependent dehydrogenase